MRGSVGKALFARSRVARGLLTACAVACGALIPPPHAAVASDARDVPRVAQLPSYTAGGLHQCGSSKDTCVVSGQFSNCSDAAITLRTRDCCVTSRKGGRSTKFTMTYCIPDVLR